MKGTEQVRLGNIANLTTGLVVSRKKSLNEKGYEYKILSLKSFNEDGYINEQYLEKFISSEEIPKHQLTQVGDVVVRLSYPNTAVYINKMQEGYIISSLFVVIRLRQEKILPQFTQIYLNSEKAKRQLMGDAIGSVVTVVKISSFKELSIPLYPINHQENVIRMNYLVMKEKDLLSKLIEEKEIQYKVIMRKMLK